MPVKILLSITPRPLLSAVLLLIFNIESSTLECPCQIKLAFTKHVILLSLLFNTKYSFYSFFLPTKISFYNTLVCILHTLNISEKLLSTVCNIYRQK